MMIRDMFADDINRKINGVIKVDQAADDVIEQPIWVFGFPVSLEVVNLTF